MSLMSKTYFMLDSERERIAAPITTEQLEKNPVACYCGSNEMVNVRWNPYEYEIYSQ